MDFEHGQNDEEEDRLQPKTHSAVTHYVPTDLVVVLCRTL